MRKRGEPQEPSTRQRRRLAKRSRRKALALGAAVGGVSAGFGGEALRAATLTVNSLADGVVDDSAVTLREALECINDVGAGCFDEVVNSGAAFGTNDTVLFAAGLTGTIAIGNELYIERSVAVEGPSAAELTVDAGGTDRVFEITCDAPLAVVIEGLTITGGDSVEGAGVRASCADYDASLRLEDVVITENDAIAKIKSGQGGGVFSRNVDLEIFGSEISQNDAGASGGGIAAYYAEVTIRDSVVSGNSANYLDGGGMYVYDSGVEIIRSTFSGNDAKDDGGGISAEGDSFLGFEQSTVSGNTAGGDGGGVYLYNSELDSENSTISGNTAGDQGGGIYMYDGEGEIEHSTVVENTAARGPALAAEYATVRIHHSILADSTETAKAKRGLGLESAAADPDLYLYGGTTTIDWSLIENPGGASFGGANNITGVDPALGPLGNNGGPTETHEPQQGSPAIDAGDPAISKPPDEDQRGLPRIVGEAIDIGSVEQQEQVSVLEIPALGGPGAVALGAGLAAAGAAALRRRRKPSN
jgi:parallel beta-helix repeat protein/predicted outer membrane repeat protein